MNIIDIKNKTNNYKTFLLYGAAPYLKYKQLTLKPNKMSNNFSFQLYV